MSTIPKDNQHSRFGRLWLTAILALLVLAGCGGSGGNTGGGFTAPDPITVSVTPLRNSIPASVGTPVPALNSQSTVQVNVRVLTNTGTAIPDGTVVNLVTSNATLGSVNAPDDPDSGDVDEFSDFFATINTETSGGNAVFFFTAFNTTGTVTLTASAQDPFTLSNITATATITIVPNANTFEPLTLDFSRSTLPVNPNQVLPFPGSPFLSEATISFRDNSGNLVNPQDDVFQVSITPASSIASFSLLDDPETTNIDEFLLRLGNSPVDAVSGRGTIFINSLASPGIATITVSAANPSTGDLFTRQFEIEVVSSGATGLPVRANIVPRPAPIFIQDSGGNTGTTFDIEVFDAADQPVPNPGAGATRFNNVRVVLTPPNANGSLLAAVNAAGQTVSGTTVDVATTTGRAEVGFSTGSTSGVHQFELIVDRADNNVDNGIQNPLVVNSSINVGDGRLFSLTIDIPVNNAIGFGRVLNPDQIDPDENIEIDETTGLPIPPDFDATYTLTVSVSANDVTGNPVVTGTQLGVGRVDAPVDSDGAFFVFSGIDGNPVEGGILFTTETIGPDGFLDGPGSDESVEAGDTVLTLGDLLPGNRELESARTVANVSTENILSVTQPFNDNNQSGVTVDDGAIIPYVIGRSTIGSITSSVVTEEDGVAEFTLTYPISVVGRPLALYVQGNRPETGGANQTVADVVLLNFPGIGPANLSVSPNALPGNSSNPVTLCATDRLGVPLRNLPITFSTNGLGEFVVADDPLVTGQDGCVTTVTVSNGLALGQEDLVVTFAGAGATAELTIAPPNTAFISASPSLLLLTSTSARRVIVTVTGADGVPAPNLPVTGECDDPVGVDPETANTGADGQAEFVLSTSTNASGNQVTGTCTFSVDINGNVISTSVIYNIPIIGPSPGP